MPKNIPFDVVELLCIIKCDFTDVSVTNTGGLSEITAEVAGVAILVYRLREASREFHASGFSNRYRLNNLPVKSRGLTNLGNSCYFNSVVQALFHCLEFGKIILNVKVELDPSRLCVFNLQILCFNDDLYPVQTSYILKFLQQRVL